MSKLRVEGFTISLDGYGAGVEQSLENPMGLGGRNLHGWAFATPTFRAMLGIKPDDGPINEVDESFAKRGFDNIGANILGRNMFGPIRGPWPNMDWRGWWGEDPPYHSDVFVLTHYPREPLVMEGGNTFYFVTDGLASAVKSAFASANGKDVRLGGGIATVREAMVLGLVDDLHIAVSPVLLGRGEALFAGLDLPALGYKVAAVTAGEKASHITLTRN